MDSENLFLSLLMGMFLVIPLAIMLSKPQSMRAISTPKKMYYENIEEWEIIKNPITGRTEGVRVKRTAKEA